MALHRPSNRWQLGLALSLVTVASWGSLPLFLKMTLRYVDAVTLMWFRFLLSGALLAFVLGMRRRLPPFHRAGKRSLGLLVLASLGLAGNYIFYQLGLGFISPGTAQLVIQTSPLMFMLGSVAIFKEQLSRMQIVGFIGLLIGFALFFNDHLAELFAPTQAMSGYTLGVIYIFIAAVTWAIYALAQKQLLTVYHSPGIMVFIYVANAILVTPISQPATILQLDGVGELLLLYCALNTIIGYGAFSEAIAHWEASKVSATLALSPLVTLALAAIFAPIWPEFITAEDLNGLSYGGTLLVVLSAMTVALGRRGPPRHAAGS